MTFHQGGVSPAYKTKKDLRAAAAGDKEFHLYSTSAFGNQFSGHHRDLPEGDTFNVVGPDPYRSRSWYASVTRKNGKTVVKSALFGMAKFEPLVKRFVPAEQRRKLAHKGEAMPDGSFPIANKQDLANAEALEGKAKNPKAAKRFIARRKRELNKGVPAGTRPFARRALPNEDVKQVRAKAPRYSIAKAINEQKTSGRVLSGPNCELCKIRGRSHPPGYMHRETREAMIAQRDQIKKSCENCGVRPSSGGLPLCVRCADPFEKARKKKPDMVDHIMRMEGGDAGEDESRHAMQQMVNSGDAWKMQGSYGRAAMDMIRGGHIALGHTGHRDYYGNYVPSRHEVQEGTKGHASFVRAAGFEPDKCGKDCPSPEVPNQLPQSIRNKNVTKAFFSRFPLGPLSKTYVRVDATRAEAFLKADGRGYPQSQCPTCGKHGNALEVMQHMQSAGHSDDDQGKNAHTKIGRAVPELDGHIGMGTLKSMRKGMEFKILDEQDPEYHGHTGGGAGYSGKKWVHMHGPQASADGMAGELMPVHAKTNHRHFKMGAWTTNHSPSGYQEDIIGQTDKGEDDPACGLPNCRHPLSQHVPTDDGPMGCKDCNNTRPRRNVRHEFRA